MSARIVLYKIEEVHIDDDLNFSQSFLTNLPHAKEIGEDAMRSWNSLPMADYFSDELKGKIADCKMDYTIDKNGGLDLRIKTTAIPRFRLTQARTDAIYEQISAQLSDGWGESFFGPINKKAYSGGYYYPE